MSLMLHLAGSAGLHIPLSYDTMDKTDFLRIADDGYAERGSSSPETHLSPSRSAYKKRGEYDPTDLWKSHSPSKHGKLSSSVASTLRRDLDDIEGKPRDGACKSSIDTKERAAGSRHRDQPKAGQEGLLTPGDTRGKSSKNRSSVIAFNAKDALDGSPLIDPVLGSDGLSQLNDLSMRYSSADRQQSMIASQ